MAIIELKGTALNYSAGLGAFDMLNTAWTSTMRSTTSLHDAIETLQLQVNVAASITPVGTAQELVQKAEARETAKQSALSLAYEKLDALIMKTAVVDQRVADVINTLQADFYKSYPYLEPDNWLEEFCGDIVNGWNSFWDGIGSAIAGCIHDVVEWCKEHWKVVVAVIVIVAIGVAAVLTGGTLAAVLAAAFWSALKGAAVGAILGGLASIVEGESFWEGFENGLLFGALLGGAFGALGEAAQFLGSSCQFLSESGAAQFLVSHFMTVVKVAKFSGIISLSMFGFDLLALGSGLAFGKDNWLTSANRELHQNVFYNAFQFSVSVLAVFSGGLVKGMQNPTCFVAGTPVLTANGLVAIENIKAGDKVISTDPDTGVTEEKTVLEVFRRSTTELVHLSICGEEIITTHEHPFFVVGKGFVNAGELRICDILRDSSQNRLTIDDIFFETSETPTPVYNFKVEDYHTYYVGEQSVLVHNANCLPQEKYLDHVDENGDRYYKRELVDGKTYEVKYTKGSDGEYYARFEDYATHPDFPDPVYPAEKGIILNGNEQHDLGEMLRAYGKPKGYTWHHIEDGEGMILVETKVHQSFHHSGGAGILRN